jgi:carboxypeptidase C (cathepsin A)
MPRFQTDDRRRPWPLPLRWGSRSRAGAAACLLALSAGSAGAFASDEHPAAPSPSLIEKCQIDVKGDKKDEWMREPKGASSVTTHRFAAGGKTFEYVATAGTLVIRDDDDKPTANIGYVAYTRKDVKDPGQRPILFAFNGGPGSSSMWLHMGALGPRRVVVSDPGPTPPAPYKIVDNEFGVLDKSDLVMIDPVGTGISRAVCDHKDDEFWGVDPDIDSVSRFIAQYLSDNNRWTSPKYLLGESYGTTRAAAIADYLRAHRDVSFNGLVLVSVATDLEAVAAEFPGNDRPYALYLPAYAAAAWYHHMLPQQPAALDPFLDEVRKYALGPYTAALLKGDALSDADRDAAAAQLHQYTGLPVEYLKEANLRVSEVEFQHELLRAQRKTIGRLDARYAGPTLDPLAKNADYDPQSAAISAAYTAAFLDYYHGDLKFGQGQTYRELNEGIESKWKWTHKTANSDTDQPIVNSGVDLADDLIQEANLRVLVMAGYFDLATPFSATEYVMSHLGIPAAISSHIQIKYYESGHMVYVHPPSLKKMKGDLDAFMDSTTHP